MKVTPPAPSNEKELVSPLDVMWCIDKQPPSPSFPISLYKWLIFIKSQANGKQEEEQPDIITTKNNDYYGFMDQFYRYGFTCEATGTNLQFFWRHRDILVDEKYPLKFPRLNTSNLQPTKGFLTKAYDGTYQCFAKNSIGTVFGRKATVKFTSKVVFTFYSLSGLEITAKMRSCWVILLPCQLFSQVTLSLIQLQKNKLTIGCMYVLMNATDKNITYTICVDPIPGVFFWSCTISFSNCCS